MMLIPRRKPPSWQLAKILKLKYCSLGRPKIAELQVHGNFFLTGKEDSGQERWALDTSSEVEWKLWAVPVTSATSGPSASYWWHEPWTVEGSFPGSGGKWIMPELNQEEARDLWSFLRGYEGGWQVRDKESIHKWPIKFLQHICLWNM